MTDASGRDSLAAAFGEVGRHLGFEARVPDDAPPSRPAAERVAAIARASRVRVRDVLLRDGWWTRDAGALLATVEDPGRRGGGHVALVPVSAERYRMWDPATGASRPVTAEIARTVAPRAVSVLRSHGLAPMTARDIRRVALRGTRGDVARMAAAGVAVAALGLVVPVLSGLAIDRLIPAGDRRGLAQVVALAVVLALAGAAFALARGIALLRLEARLELNVETALMDRLLRLPAGFFRRFAAGDLGNRVIAAAAARHLLAGGAVAALLGGAFSVVGLAVLLAYGARLALAGLLLAAVAAVTSAWAARASLARGRVLAEREGRVSGLVLQLISGIAKLRVAAAEDRAYARWAERFAEERRAAMEAGEVRVRLDTFAAAYPAVSLAALVAAATLAGASDAITPGRFAAAALALDLLLGGILGMGAALVHGARVVPLVERALPLLATAPEVREGSAEPGPLAGALALERVTFRYDEGGPPVLDDVSLRAEPGEVVAIVGRSGSGKSTVLRLLLGLEQPTAGRVTFDGRDLASLDVEAVRRQLGVVLQTGRVAAGDLLTNIAGGAAGVSVDEAWEAARIAGLADDIRRMPMGMYTMTSEGGGTLSGGQRQRLLLARAVARRPRILLLDEATSALDRATQHAVTEALAGIAATRVVIAHRLSTIRHADRIYVMAGGRVAEEGDYAALLARGGEFTRLARRQLVEG